jgi:excinuclease ABC subunit C
MIMPSPTIAEHLKHFPLRPGVYLFKDGKGNVIYVGKANLLRHRVRSYFQKSDNQTEKTRQMVQHIRDLEFFVTNSEQEALVLEQNLVKRYRPHYNIRLKDDKAFPFIKIDLKDEWPRIFMTRRVFEDGGRYFGPFTSSWSVRETLKALKKIFRFRTCPGPTFDGASRACLEYHIGQCSGPCTGNIAKEEYARIIKQVILFLEGRESAILKQLKMKMEKASDALDFERAAIVRDQIAAIERVIEGQKIGFPVSKEQDVIAFAAEKDVASVQVFLVRDGRVIGRETFTLVGVASEEPVRIMSSFVKQFYSSAVQIPPLIMLQYPVEDKSNIEEWLASRRGSRVRLHVPARGKQKQLVDMVASNAAHGLEQLKLKQTLASTDLTVVLEEIQQALHLPHLPERMECYDISNIQGKMPVGSMVVFEMGKPKTSDYRRFSIKTVTGADDFAMLAEVLKRRFKRGLGTSAVSAEPEQANADEKWTKIPDLVLVDGGKGQLNAALAAMKDVGASRIPAAGLAKEREEIFLPGKSAPVVLPESSPARQMLQRLRDEAHRFAVTYHRKVRKKETFASQLDAIPGIGAKRKRALLRKFGSVKAIREAEPADIAAVANINAALAQKVKTSLVVS